jgi:hypothetical protein
MKHIKIFEEFGEKVVIFTNERNKRQVIKVTKTSDGRITEIDNPTGVRFAFSVGQLFNRNAEIWASNNNFLMDGKDMSPEKKVMGIKVSDIPLGHELRTLYPGKFRK